MGQTLTSFLPGAQKIVPENGTDLSTVCVLCSCNCGLSVDVSDGRIVKVRGDNGTPYSAGHMCNKAVTIPHYVDQARQHATGRRDFCASAR